jgi:hypothetical protein
MAEHALAMTLAAANRLIVEHDNLRRSQFNQFTRKPHARGRRLRNPRLRRYWRRDQPIDVQGTAPCALLRFLTLLA